MTEIAPYTLWTLETGEIYSDGDCVMGKKEIPEGCAIHWGEKLKGETHIFDVETHLPLIRSTPRPIQPDEVSPLVNRERQRRIEFGKDFGGVWVTGSDKDILNLTNLAMGAQLRISLSDPTVSVFRDGLNVEHELTPLGLLGLWQAASTYVEDVYKASWALKAMDPFPLDYASDTYWP